MIEFDAKPQSRREKDKVLVRAVLALLLTAVVPILLILGNIRLVMTETYLRIEYYKPDFPADTYGFTLSDRLYYAPFALQYLLNDAEIDYLGSLTLPTGGPFYTPDELRHMADVKVVIHAAMIGLVGVSIATAALILLLMRSADGRQSLRHGLFRGSILTLTLLGSLLLYVLLDWDNFFTRFHNLFFAEGSWTFDFSDSLIRLFPIRFWQDAALTVGGLSAVTAIFIAVGMWWWGRRAR